MTPNIPLLRQVREQIERHPETWEQDIWFSECGTKACVAGWAARLAGGKRVTTSSVRLLAESGDDSDEVYPHWRTGDPSIHVADRAARVLGLDFDTARILFRMDNSIDDVRRIMDEIEEGARESVSA